MADKAQYWQAALAMMVGSVFSVSATAEIQASAGVASTYLFRGVDAGDGNAQVFGDLTYSTDLGVYASLWGSSAGSDTQEYDLILGWSKNYDGVNVNVGVINYVLPGDSNADTIGSESEAYAGFGYQGFELYLYRNIASKGAENEGYLYVAMSYTYSKFSGTLGHALDHSISDVKGQDVGVDGEYDYLHLDLTYAFNDNLSFTLSKIVSRNADWDSNTSSLDGSEFTELATVDDRFGNVADDDTLFVMTYSLPLEI